MDLIDNVEWKCIEWNENKKNWRSLTVLNVHTQMDVGDSFYAANSRRMGTVIASSKMGVTVFDLFSEIFNEDDMLMFLEQHQIEVDGLSGGGLAVRCFLLLLDLQKNVENNDGEKDESFEVIKLEKFSCSEGEDFSPTELTKPESGSERSYIYCRNNPCNCGQKFVSEQAKRDHLIHKAIYKCSDCSETYPTCWTLRVHRNAEHKTDWKCKVSVKCKKTFENEATYQDHVENFKHFNCDPCVAGFTTQKQLRSHQKMETCKYLICDNCGKNFKHIGHSRLGNFSDHINACKNLRPFVCEFCGDGFNQRSIWKQHIKRKHTIEGEQRRLLGLLNQRARLEARRVNPRKYNCQQCEMSYTTNQKLKFHIMTHNGTKSECKICSKPLSSPTSLRTHMQRIHKISVTVCEDEIVNIS